jgi:hypothetical protein
VGIDLLWELSMSGRRENYRDERSRLLDNLDDAIAWGLRDAELDITEQINNLDEQYYQDKYSGQD